MEKFSYVLLPSSWPCKVINNLYYFYLNRKRGTVQSCLQHPWIKVKIIMNFELHQVEGLIVIKKKLLRQADVSLGFYFYLN